MHIDLEAANAVTDLLSAVVMIGGIVLTSVGIMEWVSRETNVKRVKRMLGMGVSFLLLSTLLTIIVW